jgi:hypothetical protein
MRDAIDTGRLRNWLTVQYGRGEPDAESVAG